MAFSQGCALSGSLLLNLQHDIAGSTSSHLPFKFAVFICGSLPLNFLEDQGYDISRSAKDTDRRSGEALQSQASFDSLLLQGRERWQTPHCVFCRNDIAAAGHSCPHQSTNKDLQSAQEICGLDCTQLSPKHAISISTVHVYGSRDPRVGSALHLARFCNPEIRRIFDHGGGHDIPRNSHVSKSIAELISWAMASGTRGS